MPYVIMGFVRRGGSREPQKSSWDGRSWTKNKAMVYPSQAAAQKAAYGIKINLVDSFAIFPVGCK